MLRTYKLVPLVELKRETQLQVLKIRNEEHIREWMYTQDIISINDHFSWIERLKEDQSRICLVIIKDNDQVFGVINLMNIDRINKRVEMGCYRTLKNTEKGLMNKCLSKVMDYSFFDLGMEKVYSEVFEGNIKSANMLTRILFVEEGFMRSHIILKKKRIGIHIFGLLKNDWQMGKNKLNTVNDIKIDITNV